MAENPVGPVADIVFSPIGDGTVSSINKTSALIGYRDGNNTPVQLLSRYCADPMPVAHEICNAINNVTDGAIRNLSALTYSTDQVLGYSPQHLPESKTLKFRYWEPGQDINNDPPKTMTQFIPYAVFESAEELKAVGDRIAAALTADANFQLVEFRPYYRRS